MGRERWVKEGPAMEIMPSVLQVFSRNLGRTQDRLIQHVQRDQARRRKLGLAEIGIQICHSLVSLEK